MVMVCGISNYSTSLFHLMNHAFFKALLFLSAGSVIHAVSNEQDMRKMGGLIKSIPFTYTMIFIANARVSLFNWILFQRFNIRIGMTMCMNGCSY